MESCKLIYLFEIAYTAFGIARIEPFIKSCIAFRCNLPTVIVCPIETYTSARVDDSRYMSEHALDFRPRNYVHRVGVENCVYGSNRPDLIVDINLSARHLLKFIGGALIGQPARKVLPIWPEIERGQDAVITIPDATTTSKAPLAVRHIDTHVTPLLDQHKRVIGRMFILRDVTLIQQQKAEIQALQDRLRAEAIHDELTGLYNRHYFGEALALGLAQARRDNLPFSLVILDVDHFKEINEARGDAAGDLLLQQAANLLTRSTRGGDVICRYGGDEFALLLPNTSLEDAFSCAERWRHGMEKLGALDGTQGALFQFTVSLGMAGYPNCEGSMDELLAVADQALYTAKKSGRNRTVLWRQAPVNPSDAPTP